ncbi:hypothetical protein AUK40_06210 [Candidatus Wirthbacteria bacterium CG2_30_54_11]|uniref:Uncharacterized protein n=1 Tax=Candidatus Wirthbacteria bacterium CG2_30_54_11 TaxID=1817892 RepID=A0A1J5IDL7_9BACT|nr:MAG: hypothetical protein AUK40_06210 [Candidatus Wirthbacteria bacterium CG2_30_54_11]
MNAIISRILFSIVLFVLTLVSGFIVAITDNPYNIVFFTIHKLFALVTTIVTGIAIYQMQKGIGLKPVVVFLVVVSVLFVIALFSSGAMLSIQKTPASAVLIVHRIVPVLMTVSAGATVFFLTSGK